VEVLQHPLREVGLLFLLQQLLYLKRVSEKLDRQFAAPQLISMSYFNGIIYVLISQVVFSYKVY
jgi:hypothetical protein